MWLLLFFYKSIVCFVYVIVFCLFLCKHTYLNKQWVVGLLHPKPNCQCKICSYLQWPFLPLRLLGWHEKSSIRLTPEEVIETKFCPITETSIVWLHRTNRFTFNTVRTQKKADERYCKFSVHRIRTGLISSVQKKLE